MNDALALDHQLLTDWMQVHVPGFTGPLTASKFKGGQSNPTYRIDAASGIYVLRRKPAGKLLASAHAVDREFRVLRALHGHGVPLAQPLALCEDSALIGSMFYVMEFVDGRIFWDPALPEIENTQRGAYYEEIIRVLMRCQQPFNAGTQRRIPAARLIEISASPRQVFERERGVEDQFFAFEVSFHSTACFHMRQRRAKPATA